ncbi:MAG TPA: hypothetical protein VFZ55_01080 [Nitrososphaera sp.]
MFGLGLLPLFTPFETNRTTTKLTAIRMMTVHVFSNQIEPASMPNKIDQEGQ